jgi:hypothetical protein
VPNDLFALIRRDHHDLDLALAAMVNPKTPIHELETLVEVFQLALAVHVAAELRIASAMLSCADPPLNVRAMLLQSRKEHIDQNAAGEQLARLTAGSTTWYERALELRVSVLDHAWWVDYATPSVSIALPTSAMPDLSARYATERMRVLADTSPLATARKAAMVAI